MTCIVGLVHDGDVYIGGDAAGVDGADLRVRSDKKVYLRGDYAIGFAGSFRQGQLIHYALEAPPLDPTKDLSAFMVTTFVDAVRACLAGGGVTDGGETYREDRTRGRGAILGRRERPFRRLQGRGSARITQRRDRCLHESPRTVRGSSSTSR